MIGLVASITVLLHGTVIDGTGTAPFADAAVEIQDDRIAAIASAASYEVPEGAAVIDASGKWIIPGLIDTHTHFLDSGSLYTSPDDFDLTAIVPHDEERRRIREAMPETLDRYRCSGVTTVASLGGARWELEVARASSAPHVLTSGPFLANFPVGEITLWTRDDPVLVQIASPDGARSKARELARRGVDLIKVGYAGDVSGHETFRPVLEALVDEAHGSGLRVAMHAEELETAKMAVRAGIDVLAHTIVDRVVDEEFLALVKTRGITSITGLAHFDRYRDVLEGTVELLPIEKRCGDARVIASWNELDSIVPEDRPPMPAGIRWGSSDAAREILHTNVRKMHEAGVALAAGSNGGNVGTLQGPSYHWELHRLADAGIPLDAILVAATRDAALSLGLDDRGTLETGKLADIVVLSENPLEDVSHFQAVDRVIVAGDFVDVPARAPSEPMSYRGAPWLERESRFDEERPDLVIEAMKLQPGDVVADVGTGSGYYARRIAPHVMPGGRVYAVDIQEEMLAILERRIAEEKVSGIVPVLSEPDDPKLPTGEVDWILLADVYHEIAEPKRMLARMKEALAPGGRVVLLEYRVEDGTADHVKADHAMSVRQVLAEWSRAGFELAELHELLPTQHMFVFGEPGVEQHDFHDAVASGIVEARAEGFAEIRIRRRVDRPIVVTLPVGTYFDAPEGRRDLVARRDAAVFLDDESWHDWTVRAVGRERAKPAPSRDVELTVLPPSTAPHLAALMRAIQTGTYRLDGIQYPARTLEVEQAAVWIADQDLSYGEMLSDLSGARIPPQYAVAFALVFCDAAGIDVTRRRVWSDREIIFGALRESWVTRWYELTLAR